MLEKWKKLIWLRAFIVPMGIGILLYFFRVHETVHYLVPLLISVAISVGYAYIATEYSAKKSIL